MRVIFRGASDFERREGKLRGRGERAGESLRLPHEHFGAMQRKLSLATLSVHLTSWTWTLVT